MWKQSAIRRSSRASALTSSSRRSITLAAIRPRIPPPSIDSTRKRSGCSALRPPSTAACSALLAEALEVRPRPPPHQLVQPGEADHHPGGPTDRLPGPLGERKGVAMIGDQAIPEAKARAHVVDHRAPGAGERVAGDPAGAAGVALGLVLGELHVEVFAARGQ